MGRGKREWRGGRGSGEGEEGVGRRKREWGEGEVNKIIITTCCTFTTGLVTPMVVAIPLHSLGWHTPAAAVEQAKDTHRY